MPELGKCRHNFSAGQFKNFILFRSSETENACACGNKESYKDAPVGCCKSDSTDLSATCCGSKTQDSDQLGKAINIMEEVASSANFCVLD